MGKALAKRVSKVTRDDPAYQKSLARHEFKKMRGNLPHNLKRDKTYLDHMRNHYRKENNPSNWSKYGGK